MMTNKVPEHWMIKSSEAPGRVSPPTWFSLPMLAVAALFAPRRVGRCVALATWPRTLAILVAMMMFAALLGAIAMSQAKTDRPESGHFEWTWADETAPVAIVLSDYHPRGERLRRPLAVLVNNVYSELPLLVDSSTTVVLAAVGMAAIHILAPLFLMACLPVSLSVWRRYLRCVKLGLWASVCWMPGIALGGIFYYVGEVYYYDWQDISYAEYFFSVGFILFAWWSAWIIKLGGRPVHAEEAAAVQIAPHCGRCGYQLTGLPVDGACPECGREVALSMPEHRRPPRWASATGLGAKMVGFITTTRGVYRKADFFAELAVHSGREAAIRFLVASSIVTGLLTAIAIAGFLRKTYLADVEDATTLGLRAFTGGLAAGVAVACISFVSVAIKSRFCVRRPGPILVTTCYASALAMVLPLAALVIVGLGMLRESLGISLTVPMIVWQGYVIERFHVVAFVCGVLVFLPIMLASNRVRRAYRDVRFASA